MRNISLVWIVCFALRILLFNHPCKYFLHIVFQVVVYFKSFGPVVLFLIKMIKVWFKKVIPQCYQLKVAYFRKNNTKLLFVYVGNTGFHKSFGFSWQRIAFLIEKQNTPFQDVVLFLLTFSLISLSFSSGVSYIFNMASGEFLLILS